MEGVLSAIRFARETGRPFLGTCGGFQHALIEYARNVCASPMPIMLKLTLQVIPCYYATYMLTCRQD